MEDKALVGAIVCLVLGVIFGWIALEADVSPQTGVACAFLALVFFAGAAAGSDPKTKHGESHDLPHP